MTYIDDFSQRSLQAAKDYIQTHPTYELHEQPLMWRGATNRIVRARRQGQPVVFKCFERLERWQRERYGLHHFASTELVPQIIDDEQQNLIVMAELPMDNWPTPELGNDPSHFDVALASRSVGEAAARFVQVPLPETEAVAFEQRFYQGQTLAAYLDEIVQAGHTVQANCPLYQRPLFQQSLAFVSSQRPVLLRYPRLLYHQDAGNISIFNNKVSGFFDLEMCRVGTLPMQIGSLFLLFHWTPIRWNEFRQGFEDTLGRKLDTSEVAASLAFAHFMIWRSITQFGEWNGLFTTTEQANQESLDAIDYAMFMSRYNATIQEAHALRNG